MPLTPLRLALLVLPVLVLAGCGGPLSLKNRLAGEWSGRVETAEQRLRREWPGDAEPDEEALRAAEPTDLERHAPVEVLMTLDLSGDARLSLDGGRRRQGVWSVEAGEARRALLELAVRPEGDTAGDEAGPLERRRFVVELSPENDRLVLIEEGADPRYGRLIFTPRGEDEERAPSPQTI